MNAGQLAALIAAGFWAVLVCVAVWVLIRLARLAGAASRVLAEWHARSGELLVSAQAAVQRSQQQLDRTDAITASMDQVTASMAELSGHVSALSGLAGAFSGALGGPLLRLAAAAYGIRRAVAIRRPVPPGQLAESRPALSAPQPAAAQPAAAQLAAAQPAAARPAGARTGGPDRVGR
jgi:hypothetical protein